MLTAIFGGTFNPFHIGHYEMLKSLQNDSNIEKILLIPDRLPPHKTSEFLIDDETRIEMCKIAAEEFSKCELCLIEFERKGKSYTYDTLMLLKEKNPKTNFAFVMGGDMLVYFHKWYKYKELIKMVPFIVFKRTTTDESEFNTYIDVLKNEGMNIILKNDLIPNISSTEIRADFKNNKALITPKIYDFLTKRGVYSE